MIDDNARSSTNEVNLTRTGDNVTDRLVIDVPDGSGNQLTVGGVLGDNSAALDPAEINDLQGTDTDGTAVKAVVVAPTTATELTDNLDRQPASDMQNRFMGVSDTVADVASEMINADIYRVVTRATRSRTADNGNGNGHDDGRRRRTGSARADGPEDADMPLVDDDDEEKQTWRDMQQIDTSDIVTDIGSSTTKHLNWEPPGSSVRCDLAQRTYDGGTDVRVHNGILGGLGGRAETVQTPTDDSDVLEAPATPESKIRWSASDTFLVVTGKVPKRHL